MLKQVGKLIIAAACAWAIGLILFLADAYRVLKGAFINPVELLLPTIAIVLCLALLVCAPVLWLTSLVAHGRAAVVVRAFVAGGVGLLLAVYFSVAWLHHPLDVAYLVNRFASFYVIAIIMGVSFGLGCSWATRPANRMKATAGGSGGGITRNGRAPAAPDAER